MSSRVLTLSEAVHEIIDATKPRPWQTRLSTPGSQFFFVVGAGISHPSIPLASGIEELCRQEIVRRGRTLPITAGTRMERYEKYFQAAFPHAEERRGLLHHHIKSAPISAANLRLAHLVSSGMLSNLVVTTNFDELLTKALRLFGKDVIVCDHPKTTQRIDPKRDDIQVVHVHGTHWFYDCCNLREEIEDRAQDDRDDNSSMGQLLDRIFHDRSPLVVGYSGWEGDVVMAALKRRLKSQLSYNLYWFCFSRADMEALPNWLKEHGSVRLVVPPSPPSTESGMVASSAVHDTPGGAVLAVPTTADIVGDSKSKEPLLPARQVFEALLRGLKVEEPRLTKESLDFFAEQLRKNLVAPDVSDEDDTYLIRQVIRYVEGGAELARQAVEKESQKRKSNTLLLDQVSKAVRSAVYVEAVEAAQKIEPECLSETQRVNFEAALEAIHLSASDLPAETQLGVCAARIRLCEVALASDDKAADWLLREAKALIGKAYWLSMMGRQSDAVAVYDEVVRRFGDAAESALKVQAARALLFKGIVLGEEGNRAGAIERYNEIVHRFGEVAESSMQEQIAYAFLLRGVELNEEGKRAEAIENYNEIVRRFGKASEPILNEVVARALINKGVALGKAGKRAEAIENYNEVVRRFGEASEPVLKEAVVRALSNKGDMLGEDGRRRDAIENYNEIVRRFGEASESIMKTAVARALVNKGIALNKEGSRAEAIENYDEAVRRFGEASEPALKVQAAAALLCKGISLDEDGKRAESIESYTEVVRRFGNSIESALKMQIAMALVNRGGALDADGRMVDAIESYDEVMRRFGDASESTLIVPIARALFSKGLVLGKNGRKVEAIESYDEVVRRFGEASEPALKELVARALFSKGDALGEAGKRVEAIESYDEVVRRFGEASEPALKVQAAAALLCKSIVLREAGKREQAIEIYDEVMRRFGDSIDSILKKQGRSRSDLESLAFLKSDNTVS